MAPDTVCAVRGTTMAAPIAVLSTLLTCRGRRCAHDLLEGDHETIHFFGGADRDAQMLRHRRERTADEDAFLAEGLDDRLHFAAQADHEEVGLRWNDLVTQR